MADVQLPSVATATPAAADTVAGVQGGAVKRFAISALPFTQAGTGAVARTALAKMQEVSTSPEDFGAVGDGATDDSASMAAAVAALPAGGVLSLKPGATYKLVSAVSVSSALTVLGHGAKITVHENRAFSISAPITVIGAEFDSTASSTTVAAAIYGAAAGLGGTIIEHCKFGRVSVVVRDSDISDATASNGSVRLVGCSFSGDYTGSVGSDASNVVDIRGAQDVHIAGCDFNVISVERFLKISDACRRVFIRGNTFRCNTTSIGKQAIDLYTDAREVHVTDNIADLTSFTAFVENKNGDGAAETSIPSEVRVSGNTIKMSGASSSGPSAVALYGAWGLAEDSLARSTADVSRNTILLETTGDTGTGIVVRGFTHAIVGSNIFWRDDTPTYGAAVEVSNCQREIVSGNNIEYGHISIGLARSHPGGSTYANPPDDVRVDGNVIAGFGAQSGVLLFGTGTIDRVAISGNTMIATAGKGSSGVVRVDTGTIAVLSCTDNVGVSLTSADAVFASGGAATSYRLRGNSWQVGSKTVTPGSVSAGGEYNITISIPGARVGDIVSAGLPYPMQGANVVARITSSGNARITIQNGTGGPLTFAEGTFSVQVSR